VTHAPVVIFVCPTEMISGGNAVWPYHNIKSPDILISTPGYLAKFIRGPVILEEGLFESIRYLVLDEVSS
jgi:superfamily II DNA/RNA helicase